MTPCPRCTTDMEYVSERYTEGLVEYYHCPICAWVIWLNHNTPAPAENGRITNARHLVHRTWNRRPDKSLCSDCGKPKELGRMDYACKACRKVRNI